MPLVHYFRGVRIWKAKRSKRLKGRPAWQDQDPGTKQGRDAYAIAAKYESDFSRAFLDAVRGLITPEIERDFREAWKSGSPSAVINSMPYFAENPDASVWRKFTERLAVAYLTVIQAAGDDATSDLNKGFKTDLKFYALPPPQDTEEETGPIVEGLIGKSMEDVRRAARGMTVEVNPYSVKWVEDRGLELVEQGITAQQKAVVTNIIETAMSEGLRPTDALDRIKANIGLTNREYGAALKRMQLHLDAGLSVDHAERLTAKYREELLTKRARRIARTETIAAQAQGRKAAWQVAQDSGKLPNVVRRWIAPPPSPNPDRPCDICLELDGKTAALNEPYDSLYSGMVDGPPAHVMCRCSETLERA